MLIVQEELTREVERLLSDVLPGGARAARVDQPARGAKQR